MSLTAAISLAAAFGHLALGGLVFLKGSRSPLKVPVTLLCLTMFTWNFATFVFQQSGEPVWHWLDVTASPMTAPLAFWVILAFVGRSRIRRTALILAFTFFGLLSVSSLLSFWFSWAETWVESSGWSLVYLAGWLPIFGVCLHVLVRHLRSTARADERARTRLMIAALAIAGVLSSTEMWNDLFNLPALGSLGTLIGAGLMALVAVRLELFGRDLSTASAIYAVGLTGLGVLACFAVAAKFDANLAVLILGAAAVGMAIFAGAREVMVSRADQRTQLEHLAALGRFSAQMGHDLKNPLAALLGAIQFLSEERKRGLSDPEQDVEFLDLMEQQVKRIQNVVDKYQRLASIEPALQPTDVNALIEQVVELERFAAAEGVSIVTELGHDLVEIELDQDLVAVVLENLLRNAFEALDGSESGGTITLRTSRASGRLRIQVADDGGGMTVRQAERAFDEFYTTKVDGSGLGLAFSRRVIEAHLGRIDLESTLGRGTIVQIELPIPGMASL